MTPVSQLCVSCGLCCDGAIFHFLAITPEELAAMEGQPVTATVHQGRPQLALPCPGLVNKCCTIYERRPSGCRGFHCEVAKAVIADETTLPAGMTTVRGLQIAIDALGERLQLKAPVMPKVRDALAAPFPPFSDDDMSAAREVTSLVRRTLLGWS